MDALQWMGAVRMRAKGCSAVNGCRQNESQWMLCSEWVPSEWESMDALQWMGAVRMRVNECSAVNGCRQNESLIKNITIIHTTPVHQLASGEDKSCVFVRNKSIIKSFLLQKHRLQLKYIIIIYNNASSSEKVHLLTSKSSHIFDRKQQFEAFLQMLTDGLEWCGLLWLFLSDSHSDGTHSLQSIHCWDTFLQTWWRH